MTSKERRKQKREEERRMLADFDAAVAAEKEGKAERGEAEKSSAEAKRSRESFYSSTQPTSLHCRRCKTLMEEGKCPVCGYKTYMPMTEEKRKRVKGILTAVFLGVFLVLFIALRLWR